MDSAMTLQQAKSIARHLGLTLRKVRFRPKPEFMSKRPPRRALGANRTHRDGGSGPNLREHSRGLPSGLSH
jgi:hypothetical protein